MDSDGGGSGGGGENLGQTRLSGWDSLRGKYLN